MARDVVTVDEMQRIATAVRNAAIRIEDAVKTMQETSPPMPEILLHAGTFMNQTMPRLIDWAVNAQVESKMQGEAFALGVKSRAQVDKANNDRRKKKSRESASGDSESAPAKQATKKPKR